MNNHTLLSHDYALVKNVVVIMDFHSLSHAVDSTDICLGQETFGNKTFNLIFFWVKKVKKYYGDVTSICSKVQTLNHTSESDSFIYLTIKHIYRKLDIIMLVIMLKSYPECYQI